MKRGMMVLVALLTAGVGFNLAQQSLAKGKDKEKQDKNAVEKEKAKALDKAAKEQLDSYMIARALAQWGRSNQNPAALALAGQILSSANEQPLTVGPKATEGQAKADSKPKESKPETSLSLIAEGKQMCGKDSKKLGAVETVLAMGMKAKGSTSGVRVHPDLIRGGATDAYRIDFRGGEPAMVLVRGDGDTDLDLFVYDENMNLVCADTDPTDSCLCAWQPRWTGTFIVKVVNAGFISNSYSLGVN